MNEAYAFIKECGVYFLATVSEGLPKLRPFSTIYLDKDRLYILTNKEKEVFDQIKENPNVEIVGINKDKWVRLLGTLVIDSNNDVMNKMIQQFDKVEEDENNVLLYFEDGVITFYDFDEIEKTIEF